MSIAAIGSGHPAPITPEKAEGPGPDHDGDGDDVGVPAQAQSAPPSGTGAIVDKTA